MKNLLLILFVLVAALPIHADNGRYVIKGKMSCDSLRFEKKRVSQLFLVGNVDGAEVTIDTANVVDGCFTFEGDVPALLDVYSITGFDNGVIQVFLEEGEITISPFDARFPVAARIGGTPCNDVFQSYVDVNNLSIQESKERMRNALPKEVQEDNEVSGKIRNSVFHSNNLYTKVALVDFVSKNLDSPVVLYVIKYALVPMYTPRAIEEQFLSAVPQSLRSHHMYKELSNAVKAAELKEGKLAPDISGFTLDGKELTLSSLQGKYVLIDFWASWCAPCRREFPFIKEALAYSEKSDNFVVLSYSLDSKEPDWKNCIEKNELVHKNWLHISTLKGWNSNAAKLFGVEGVPYTALIGPDGKVIAFELRGEAMVKRIKRIIDGVAK